MPSWIIIRIIYWWLSFEPHTQTKQKQNKNKKCPKLTNFTSYIDQWNDTPPPPFFFLGGGVVFFFFPSSFFFLSVKCLQRTERVGPKQWQKGGITHCNTGNLDDPLCWVRFCCAVLNSWTVEGGRRKKGWRGKGKGWRVWGCCGSRGHKLPLCVCLCVCVCGGCGNGGGGGGWVSQMESFCTMHSTGDSAQNRAASHRISIQVCGCVCKAGSSSPPPPPRPLPPPTLLVPTPPSFFSTAHCACSVWFWSSGPDDGFGQVRFCFWRLKDCGQFVFPGLRSGTGDSVGQTVIH